MTVTSHTSFYSLYTYLYHPTIGGKRFHHSRVSKSAVYSTSDPFFLTVPLTTYAILIPLDSRPQRFSRDYTTLQTTPKSICRYECPQRLHSTGRISALGVFISVVLWPACRFSGETVAAIRDIVHSDGTDRFTNLEVIACAACNR